MPDSPVLVDAALPPDARPDAALPDASPPDAGIDAMLGVLAASPDPETGSTIGPNQSITVTFQAPVDPTSITLGGTLGNAAIPGFPDPSDTSQLVIAPITSWLEGPGTLVISARNAQAEARLDLAYTVDATGPLPRPSPPDLTIRDPRASASARYDETLSRDSLQVGGTTMPKVSWSSFAAPDDTILLDAPTDGWREGDIVTISVDDLAGNPAGPLIFTAQVTVIPGLPDIHVPLAAVRVSDDDGSRPCNIDATQVATWVHEANRVYAVAGVRLDYDPALDFSSVRSTLVNSMTGTSDAAWADEKAAGNAIAATHPGHATMLFRYGPDANPTGGGFSWTDYNFAALPGFNDTSVCGHQNIQLFAHELGHYLGLAHTFKTEYATLDDAAAAFMGDPSIFDGDAILDTPADPFVRAAAVQCDLELDTVTLDGVPLAVPRDNIMSYYDSEHMTLSPTQAMRVRQGALVRTGQDIRLMLPGFPYAIEGESLVTSAQATAGVVAAQTNMRSFLGNWSQDAQLFWGSGDGATLTLSVNVATADTYRVYAVFTEAPNFGLHRVYINGAAAGDVQDLYAASVGHTPPRDLGLHALRAGINTVTIVNIGKESVSNGYALGIDYFLLGF